MVENRLIEHDNLSQNRVNNGGGDGHGTNGDIFSQVAGGTGRGNGIGEQRNPVVRNGNGQFCIPVGETPVSGRDGTIIYYQCWICNRWGHTNRNNNCPTNDTNKVSNLCV